LTEDGAVPSSLTAETTLVARGLLDMERRFAREHGLEPTLLDPYTLTRAQGMRRDEVRVLDGACAPLKATSALLGGATLVPLTDYGAFPREPRPQGLLAVDSAEGGLLFTWLRPGEQVTVVSGGRNDSSWRQERIRLRQQGMSLHVSTREGEGEACYQLEQLESLEQPEVPRRGRRSSPELLQLVELPEAPRRERRRRPRDP